MNINARRKLDHNIFRDSLKEEVNVKHDRMKQRNLLLPTENFPFSVFCTCASTTPTQVAFRERNFVGFKDFRGLINGN